MDEREGVRRAWRSCVLRAAEPTAEDFQLCALALKQAVGAALGIALGAAGLTGAAGIVLFLALSTAASFVYARRVLGLGEEAVESHALLTEGALPAAALFLLSWTLAFTFLRA